MKKEIKSIYPLKPNQIDFRAYFMELHEKKLGKELVIDVFFHKECPQQILERVVYDLYRKDDESDTKENDERRKLIQELTHFNYNKLTGSNTHRTIWGWQQNILFLIQSLTDIFNPNVKKAELESAAEWERNDLLKSWDHDLIRYTISNLRSLKSSKKVLRSKYYRIRRQELEKKIEADGTN